MEINPSSVTPPPMPPEVPDRASRADESTLSAADREVLGRFWEAVRRLPKYVKLAANLVRDPMVPLHAKGLLGAATAYTVSPIDLIPGFIPVAGQMDDVAVILLSLRTAIRLCPPDIGQAHLERAGLTTNEFDEDLDATRDAAVWLVTRGRVLSLAFGQRAVQKAFDLFKGLQIR